jgi:hypothetical protein
MQKRYDSLFIGLLILAALVVGIVFVFRKIAEPFNKAQLTKVNAENEAIFEEVKRRAKTAILQQSTFQLSSRLRG